MKKVIPLFLTVLMLLAVCGCAKGGDTPQNASGTDTQSREPAPRPEETRNPEESISRKEDREMIIQVQAGDIVVAYTLNDSRAARELYNQLPLTVEAEDFSTNEKIFYPPEALDVTGAPPADGGKGSLCYYAPWGDVVMFYDHFTSGGGLYALGEAVSGQDDIEKLSGTIEITAAD